MGYYNHNAHPHIHSGRSNDASVFLEITWQKSQEIFGRLTGENDKAFYKWKFSGFHEDFPANPNVIPGSAKNPFSNFAHIIDFFINVHILTFG